MAAQQFIIALAIFVAFIFHYLINIFAQYGKFGFNTLDIEERSRKMFIFGILVCLSVHFTTFNAEVLAWVTFGVFLAYYASALLRPEHIKRKYSAIAGIALSGIMFVWWTSQLIAIFANLNS